MKLKVKVVMRYVRFSVMLLFCIVHVSMSLPKHDSTWYAMKSKQLGHSSFFANFAWSFAQKQFENLSADPPKSPFYGIGYEFFMNPDGTRDFAFEANLLINFNKQTFNVLPTGVCRYYFYTGDDVISPFIQFGGLPYLTMDGGLGVSVNPSGNLNIKLTGHYLGIAFPGSNLLGSESRISFCRFFLDIGINYRLMLDLKANEDNHLQDVLTE